MKELEGLIRLAIQLHNETHKGDFLECPDEMCADICAESIEALLMEFRILELRRAAA